MADKSAKTRLQRALKQLELARTSRELDYAAVPFVVAAEHLIKQALDRQGAVHS
jgi:hypothetical protein